MENWWGRRIAGTTRDVEAAQAVVDALRPVTALYGDTFVAAVLEQAEAVLQECQDDLADVMVRALADGYQPAEAVAR